MNSSAPIDSDQATALSSVGLLLRKAREDQSRTREEAAHEINLRMDQLDALEHDQFERLPGDTFVRGYLRTYARWLHLDEDDVLAMYIEQSGQSEEIALSKDLRTSRSLPKTHDHGRLLSAALVVAVLILGFWLYNANRDRVSELEITGNETAVDTFSGKPLEDKAPVPQEALSSAETEVEAAAPAPASASSPWENPFTQSTSAAPAAEQLVADTASALEAETPAEPEPEPRPVAAPAARSVAQAVSNSAAMPAETVYRGRGPDEIQLRFTADCWLEIKNVDGKIIYSAVRKAGQGLQINGNGPFYLLIGKASAVELSYNGESIPVRSRNRHNSARVTLGG